AYLLGIDAQDDIEGGPLHEAAQVAELPVDGAFPAEELPRIALVAADADHHVARRLRRRARQVPLDLGRLPALYRHPPTVPGADGDQAIRARIRTELSEDHELVGLIIGQQCVDGRGQQSELSILRNELEIGDDRSLPIAADGERVAESLAGSELRVARQ